MDTPSHGFAGALLGRMLPDRRGARTAMSIGFVAAMLPDLDFYFLSDRLDYLRNHRGWSHSFVFLPVFALAIAYLAKVFVRRARFRDLFVFAALGIASHIVFDWMTSFGTMFFTPFSRERYSLDWVFIIDPFFTLIPLVGLVLAIARPAKGRRVARIAAASLFAYILFCGFLHSRALAAWRRIDQVAEGRPAAVMPQLLSPFRWLGLSDHGGSIHACFFDIGPFARTVPEPAVPPHVWAAIARLPDFYPPPERARIRSFPKPPESAVLARARDLPDVRIYRTFARFLLETTTAESDGTTTITFEDLRFLPFFIGPWARTKSGDYTREPFVYRVRLDGAGRVLDRGFIVTGRGR